jgi:sporulation protein YlmC with PRC-barrel domain
MQDHLPDETEQTEYRGHDVVDAKGEPLGTITDVVYDETANEPRLVVVDPGRFSKAHFVPLEGAEQTDEGEIVVPFEKDLVKSSPKARKDHVLSAHELVEVEQHYGVETDD